MELGPHQTQIFVSLVLVVGATLVALMCDFLKRNNQQLREITLELKVRREEDLKRVQTVLPQAVVEPPSPKPNVDYERNATSLPFAEMVSRSQNRPENGKPRRARRDSENRRAASAEALAAMQRGAQLATRRTGRVSAAEEPALAAPIDFNPALKNPTVDTSSVEIAETPAPVPPVDLIVDLMAEPAVEALAEPVVQSVVQPAAEAEPKIEIVAPAEPEVPQLTGRFRNWGSLLDKRHARLEAARKQAQKQLEPLPAPAGPVLPAGFQDGLVLKRIVESRQPVSGLVISIGASAPQNEDAAMPSEVAGLIQSLLGPNDFAAQSGADEFLLIYPGERGASAQRKLGEIAEQLWDFQLRSMESLSILFSWGGVEVHSESIDEAIASATERMQQTRRGRKILTMEPRPGTATALRRAV